MHTPVWECVLRWKMDKMYWDLSGMANDDASQNSWLVIPFRPKLVIGCLIGLAPIMHHIDSSVPLGHSSGSNPSLLPSGLSLPLTLFIRSFCFYLSPHLIAPSVSLPFSSSMYLSHHHTFRSLHCLFLFNVLLYLVLHNSYLFILFVVYAAKLLGMNMHRVWNGCVLVLAEPTEELMIMELQFKVLKERKGKEAENKEVR